MNHRHPHICATLVFAGILLSGGGVQVGLDLWRHDRPTLVELFVRAPTVANLRACEQELEDRSWLASWLRPWMQYAQLVLLRDAGQKALIGRNGWYFYRPGVEYATGRKPVQPETGDPVAAICDFRDQLAGRGVHLVVLPAPNKESVYPEQLSRRAAGLTVAVCEQTQLFLRALQAAGVEVVDLFELYAREKLAIDRTGSGLYLAQDSHWSPAGLELAARAVAGRLRDRGWIEEAGTTAYELVPAPIERVGDVVRMLEIPPIEARLTAERVRCRRVIRQNTGQPYSDHADSEILVLGDSFLRIFQQDEPGSAGFVAHLGHQLRQPVASIVNDGGASTLVRQDLHRRPALLANKKVVVWEFVERDIRFGTEGWQRVPLPALARPLQQLEVRLSWGHQSTTARSFHLRFLTNIVTITGIRPDGLEPGDTLRVDGCESRAGSGDVDAVTLGVAWPKPTEPLRKLHEIWAYLLEHGTPDQVSRLKDDPGLIPGAPVLTVVMAADNTRGFSIGLEQLYRHRAMWLPEHDVFATLADAPVNFAAHLASLKGERVLDRLKHEAEATRAEWTNRWEDIGNPYQWDRPWETSWLGTKGHITGAIARHGSLYKFGVDRWASVRPDHASPHRFRLDPLWPGCRWAGQRIVNGLPILVTVLERDGQRCEIEQFAAPLSDAPPVKRGEIASVFFTRLKTTGTGVFSLGFRFATENTNRHPELRGIAGRYLVADRETGAVWLMIEADGNLAVRPRAPIADSKDPRLEFDCTSQLAPGQTNAIVLKLASPAVSAADVDRLEDLDFARSRAETVRYWEEWLARGARFEVPEPAVNDLFRANLWHALFLPRHRTDEHGVARIDLPYSNFAYGQFNADWPINQAVYVDYMIYGLRGYFDVAEAEFAAMYHTQQKPDGRVGGYADWGVYSPGMLYSIGQNFLLSDDRASFERLLPASLKALDWCLREVARGQDSPEAPGLVVAPLNDLTHDARAWAFPNAYFAAGLDRFGRALAEYGHPRAREVAAAAGKMRVDIERAFARASIKCPVVPLADGTWINYVPCDAMTPRRLLEVWYPTDVDTGALHLARLSAIDPRGWLTTALLHDHEDNLFLNQWGMANEPVYNQQATAFLLRDEPEAAIRAFYSMMACAFSHQQLTPLEHRWAWGQYYMPPSTDGAWFDLYRHMLIHEQADGTLLLCQATPRAWLADGRQIRVERAPTYFGPLSFSMISRAADGEIAFTLESPLRQRPPAILVRLRHPDRQPIQSATVNGRPWRDFDAGKEWIRIADPAEQRYQITARFAGGR